MRANNGFVNGANNMPKTGLNRWFYDRRKQHIKQSGTFTDTNGAAIGTTEIEVIQIDPARKIRALNLGTGAMTKISTLGYKLNGRGSSEEVRDIKNPSGGSRDIIDVTVFSFDRMKIPGDFELVQSLLNSGPNIHNKIFREIRRYNTRGVQIGLQTWDDMNLNREFTPLGNQIPVNTLAADREDISGGDFEGGLIGSKVDGGGSVSTWSLNTINPISGTQDGLLQCTTVGTQNFRPQINFTQTTAKTAGKWRRLYFKYNVNSGTCILFGVYKGANALTIIQTLTGSGSFEYYYKADGASPSSILYFDGRNLFDVQIDDYSDKEVGRAGATDLYNWLISQGYSVYNASKEAAMMAYYANDKTTLGALYGGLYNYFAAYLYEEDRKTFNLTAANKDNWAVPLYLEAYALQQFVGESDGGGKLKSTADYWTAPNVGADNVTGFSALPGGYVDHSSGSFASISNRALFCIVDGSLFYAIRLRNSERIFYLTNYSGYENYMFSIRLIHRP